MKVAVQCESPLLQRSLELFLAHSLASLKQCELVIRDRHLPGGNHPEFLIANQEGAHLGKPFSKAQLLIALEKFGTQRQSHTPTPTETPDLELLEKRIAQLTQEYHDNIIKALRTFYGQ